MALFVLMCVRIYSLTDPLL